MNIKKLRGFTLIELIIAVAIIGLLAAVAYPSYISQAQDSRRAECASTLMQFASAMERDFSRNGNQYRNMVAAGAFPTTCPLDGGAPTYNLTINPLTVTTYTLVATPVNAQLNDPCGQLTLTNQLVKGQAAGNVDQCWR